MLTGQEPKAVQSLVSDLKPGTEQTTDSRQGDEFIPSCQLVAVMLQDDGRL